MDQALLSSTRYADCTANGSAAQGCFLAEYRSPRFRWPRTPCSLQQSGMLVVLMSEQQAQQS